MRRAGCCDKRSWQFSCKFLRDIRVICAHNKGINPFANSADNGNVQPELDGMRQINTCRTWNRSAIRSGYGEFVRGVVREMPIKKRSVPTIESVTRQMQVFEFRYRISTEEFLRQDFAECPVNEDDAMQWHYLREQLSALQDAGIERLYSAFPTGSGARLKNCENSSELLAA